MSAGSSRSRAAVDRRRRRPGRGRPRSPDGAGSVRRGRQPERRQTFTSSGSRPPRVLTHVALSPDGKYLVYTDNPGGRQRSVVAAGRRHQSARADPAAPGRLLGPGLRARQRVDFLLRQGPRGSGRIGVPDSTARRPVAKNPDEHRQRSIVSPDGKQLVYLRAGYPDASSSAVMDHRDRRSRIRIRSPSAARRRFLHPRCSPTRRGLPTASASSRPCETPRRGVRRS